MAQLAEQTALAGKRKASGDAAQAHKNAVRDAGNLVVLFLPPAV